MVSWMGEEVSARGLGTGSGMFKTAMARPFQAANNFIKPMISLRPFVSFTP
jgi:preprotein translocase subunit SecY